MIKHRNNILNLLQCLLGVAMGVLQYFAGRKMGMVRWLMYQNLRIEQKGYVWGIVILFLLLLLLFYKRRKQQRQSQQRVFLILSFAILVLLANGLPFFSNTRYFHSIIILLMLSLQLFKANNQKEAS